MIADSYNDNLSLIGYPEMFALQMKNNGWIRRNSIIWYKENVMPTNIKSRFTIDFEYVYFFTKSQHYFFNTQYEPLKTYVGPRFGGDRVVLDMVSDHILVISGRLVH